MAWKHEKFESDDENDRVVILNCLRRKKYVIKPYVTVSIK